MRARLVFAHLSVTSSCHRISIILRMRNSGFSVAPLVNILLGMELDSNKGIFPSFNAGDILQALPVVVPRQSFPKPSHPKPATIDSTSLSEMTPRYLVKLVGVRQCSWKLIVIFSSLISRITSGGAWSPNIYWRTQKGGFD